MKDIIKQIRIAYKSQAYYPALFLALALPDICGALESENGQANKNKYKKWFEKYISKNYKNLNGETCYYFRCAMLHQGSTIHNKSNYNRIIFLEPNDCYKFDDNIINEVLNIDLINFCKNICKGVENWLDDKIENKIIQQNIKKLIKKYPNGISPYIMGIPVIG